MDYYTLLLDERSIKAFQPLYVGDIVDYLTDEKVAAGIRTKDGKNIALFMATVDDRDLFLDWLYVLPEYRKQGFGSMLLNDMLERITLVYQVNEVHTACSDSEFYDYLQWQGFFFDKDEERDIFSAKISDMTALPAGKKKECTFRLCDLDTKTMEFVNSFLSDNADVSVTVPLPINRKEYLDQSMVCVKDSKVYGLLLLSEEADAVTVPFAYSRTDPGFLLSMMSKSAQGLERVYGSEKRLKITTVNSDSKKLVEKLFPNAARKEIRLGRKALYV